MAYRLKVVAFFLFAVALLFLADVSYSAIATLSRLNAVEADRDRWQRPSDVLEALDAKPGDTVADLGCGSGYFTLKLSSPVGRRGHVIAEDIRWLPLVFLFARKILNHEHNISIIHGEEVDPRLPPNSVNALLISNTYPEFTDSHAILAHVSRALVPRGRLVVLDRQPNPANVGTFESGEHEVSANQVERELREAGFEIISRQDQFIESDPDHETWWLIAASRP